VIGEPQEIQERFDPYREWWKRRTRGNGKSAAHPGELQLEDHHFAKDLVQFERRKVVIVAKGE
jgi:hypothetical protein